MWAGIAETAQELQDWGMRGRGGCRTFRVCEEFDFADNGSGRHMALALCAEVPEADGSGGIMCLEDWHARVWQASVILRWVSKLGEFFWMGLSHDRQGACGCEHRPPVAASAGAM